MLRRHGSSRSRARARSRRAGSRPVAAVLGLLAWLGGCATHVQGLVGPVDGRPTLRTMEGDDYRLILTGEATALAHLDGHLVAVDGIRGLGAVHVHDWRILEGIHGLGLWVGRVTLMGSQVGIEDRGSGAFYLVDDEAGRVLRTYAGQLVLVEGVVDGPHHVQAMYYRPLEGERAPAAPAPAAPPPATPPPATTIRAPGDPAR